MNQIRIWNGKAQTLVCFRHNFEILHYSSRVFFLQSLGYGIIHIYIPRITTYGSIIMPLLSTITIYSGELGQKWGLPSLPSGYKWNYIFCDCPRANTCNTCKAKAIGRLDDDRLNNAIRKMVNSRRLDENVNILLTKFGKFTSNIWHLSLS